MSENNVERINDHIFGLVIGALVALFIAATASIFTSRNVLAGIKVLNIELTTTPSDLPFILALLLLTKNLYDFYTQVVRKLRESTLGDYYSIGIMIMMLLASVLAFVDVLFPWRFLLLAPMLALTTWKNRVCEKVARSNQLKNTFRFWFRESLRHSAELIMGGLLFVFLMWGHGNSCEAWLRMRRPFVSDWRCAVAVLFYFTFLIVGTRLFLKNGDYFKSAEYEAVMKAEAEAGRK